MLRSMNIQETRHMCWKHHVLLYVLFQLWGPALIAQRFFLEAHVPIIRSINDDHQAPKFNYGFGGVFGWRFQPNWCVEGRINYLGRVETDMGKISAYTELAPGVRYLSHHGGFTWHFAAGPVFLFVPDADAWPVSEGWNDWSLQPVVHEYHRSVYYTGRTGLGAFGAFGFVFQDPGEPRLAFLAEVNVRWATWKPARTITSESFKEQYTDPPSWTFQDTTYVTEYALGDGGPEFIMNALMLRVGLHIRIGRMGNEPVNTAGRKRAPVERFGALPGTSEARVDKRCYR